jgi:hypothetical protein
VSRLRSSMVLLGICVVALFIGFLRLVTERPPPPTGSSYSTEPNGAQALYTWIESSGGRPQRLHEPIVRGAQAPRTVLILQPETPIDAAGGDGYESVTTDGGTLILAGDSLPWVLYARQLGITVEPVRGASPRAIAPDGGLQLLLAARYRLRAADAQPLLIDPNGEWLGLRKPYKQGTLIVIATPDPFLNAPLRDDPTARFTYRQLVSEASDVAFDELHHSFAPPGISGAPATVNQLLFTTAPGRAVLYVMGLVFAYLVLAGRRLGPALPARPPTETRRTMYEHVQMLANLYRRAGQLMTVRGTFARHYRRAVARSDASTSSNSAGLREVVTRIESARSESELIAAVAAAEAMSDTR